MAIHRVVTRQFGVEIARKYFNVTSFIHYLRRGVVLSVNPWHRFDNLRGAQQSPLLAVHELAQHPVLILHVQRDPFLLAPEIERSSRQVGVG